MSRFLQLHALTTYPPSNANRDDLGRPKTAEFGGVNRLRISSQALKRSVRTHPSFTARLEGALGARTQRLGEEIRDHLSSALNANAQKAEDIAKLVSVAFGKLDDKHPARIKQLAFISPDERAKAFAMAEAAFKGEAPPKDKELAKTLLLSADGAADIAMFGRMLADNPDFNREASVQVSHAITTHRVEVEDDYYTAVDDLKKPSEDMGAGFVGEAGFGSGVFYVYANIDRALLLENLKGDRALAARALEAFVEAFALASPSGKKNSFANHVRAEFLLATLGDQQPLTLANAFLNPVRGGDLMVASIAALESRRNAFTAAYGPSFDAQRFLNVRAADMKTESVFASGAAPLSDVAAFGSGGMDALPFHGPAA